MVTGVTCLGQALAERTPVILFLDDLQWADAASLDVLHYAGRSWKERRTPLLLLLSLRAETQLTTQPLAKWLSGLEHDLPMTSLTLPTLSFEDTMQLVQALGSGDRKSATGRPFALNLERFCRWLFSETGGQPFYIMEMLKALLARGLLVPFLQTDGRWTIDFEEAAHNEAKLPGILPPSIREVIRSRLGLLTASACALLVAGAVLGHDFTFDCLCQVAGLAEYEGLQALDEVLTSQLLREDQEEAFCPSLKTYCFRHDKIRDVVYSEAGDARRRVFHKRALEVLSTTDVTPSRYKATSAAQLAHHALAAGLAELAFRFSVAAGDEARRLFAHVQARRHYTEALQSLSSLPASPENSSHRVDTILKQVSVSVNSDAPERNLALLAEAEALLRALPDWEEPTGEGRLRLAHIHNGMGRVYYYCNDRREALRYFRQVLAVVRDVEHEELAAITSSMIGRVLLHQGYVNKARPLLVQAIPPLERAANWNEYVLTAGYLGAVLSVGGRYKEGEVEGQRALARAIEMHDFTARALCHLYLALIYIHGGEMQRALEESRAIVSIAGQTGDRVAVYVGYGIRAWVESRLRQDEDALASMAHQQAIAQSLGGGRLISGDWFAAIKAEIALNTRRPEEAIALAEEAVAYAQSVDGKYAEGLAQRVWGQALAALISPHWCEAEAHLAVSLQAFEAGEVLPEVARTHLAWGLLCCERQDQTSALSHLEEAAAMFEACGLTGEQERSLKLIIEFL